jgi:hypothetical protein
MNTIYKYFILLISINIFFSCNLKDKPSDLKMKEGLTNELSNKAIVVKFEQQDGLFSEKDGVKYYEGYFNAEIKFIANYSVNYRVGERYKIIKGTLAFMKTENGWNCQSFDISAANLVKIKEEGDNISHISAGESNIDKESNKNSSTDSTNQNKVMKLYDSYDGQEYFGEINSLNIRMKIIWKKNKTISAIYYFLDNPKNLNSWTGNNYTDGLLVISDNVSGENSREGKLIKSIDENSIVWSGKISNSSGEEEPVIIRRPR